MSGLFANLPDIPRGTKSSSYRPPVPSSDPVQREKESQIQALIDSTIRVTLTDNRVFEGQFYCYDNYGHILINHAVRIWNDSRRNMGIVVAQPEHIVKVEVLERKEINLDEE